MFVNFAHNLERVAWQPGICTANMVTLYLWNDDTNGTPLKNILALKGTKKEQHFTKSLESVTEKAQSPNTETVMFHVSNLSIT